MKKKLLTFLALLTVLFSLPQVANADWQLYGSFTSDTWTWLDFNKKADGSNENMWISPLIHNVRTSGEFIGKNGNTYYKHYGASMSLTEGVNLYSNHNDGNVSFSFPANSDIAFICYSNGDPWVTAYEITVALKGAFNSWSSSNLVLSKDGTDGWYVSDEYTFNNVSNSEFGITILANGCQVKDGWLQDGTYSSANNSETNAGTLSTSGSNAKLTLNGKYKVHYNIVTKKLWFESTTVATPTITISPDAGTYNGTTKELTFTASNIAAANTAYYKIGNGSKVYFAAGNSTANPTIGSSSATDDQTITVTYSADGTTTNTATYTLKAPRTWTVYAVATAAPKIWLYNNSEGGDKFGCGSWPGATMTAVSGHSNLYSYTYTNYTAAPTKVQFNSEGSARTANTSGQSINGYVFDLTTGTKYATLAAYEATLTPAVTLTNVQIQRNSGSWLPFLGSSNKQTFEDLSSTDKFIVKATYSDNSTTTFVVNGASESTGDKGLYEGSTANKFFNETKVCAVKAYAHEVGGVLKMNVTWIAPAVLNLYIEGGSQWAGSTKVAMTRTPGTTTFTATCDIANNKNVIASNYNESSYSWTNFISDFMYNGDGKNNVSIPYATNPQTFVKATSGTWKTTQEGTYTFSLNLLTMKATITCQTVTLSSLKLYKGSDEVSPVSGQTNTWNLSDLQGNESFHFEATYSDNTTENYYWHSDISDNASSIALNTTASGAKGFADDVMSATLKVTLEGKTPKTLAASNVTKVTYTNNKGSEAVTGQSNLYTITRTDQRGKTVYFKKNTKLSAPGMKRAPGTGADETLDAGTYSLTATDSEWKIALADPSYTMDVTWNADNSVPTLKVTDPSAGIKYVKLWRRRGSGDGGDYEVAEFTNEGNGVFTLVTTVDEFHSDWWSCMHYLKSSDGTYSGDKYWTKVGDAWAFGPNTNQSLQEKNEDKFFMFNPGGRIKITVTRDPSDPYKLKTISYKHLGPENIYFYEKNGDSWNKVIANAANDGDGNFVVNKVKLTSGNEIIFSTRSNGSGWANLKADGHSRYNYKNGNDANLPITDSPFSNARDAGVWKVTSTGFYRINVSFTGAGEGTLTVTKVSSLLPDDVVYQNLNFYPRVVRNSETADGGKDWSKWTNDMPIVFVLGNNINDERLQPDWEMTRIDNNNFKIENVALRGNLKNGDFDIAMTLKARVIMKNSDTHTDVELTDARKTALLDALENTTELMMGRQFNLTLTRANASSAWVLDWELVSKLPPYIGIIGGILKQADNLATPHGNSDQSWQEAYVLYDENEKPIKDFSGDYIYSTQWPPRYPIYFTTDKEDMKELTSKQLTFTPTKNSKTGVYEIMTGAEWVTALQAKDATDYSNLTFNGGTEETDYSSVKYAHYVVDNVWFAGPAKFWTGWTSGYRPGTTEALWDWHANWGYGNEGDKNTADDGGEILTNGTTAPLKINWSNIYFGTKSDNTYNATPTYFKTIELFIPVDENGIALADQQHKAKAYTIVAYGNATIAARAAKINGSTENNTGAYKPTFTLENSAIVTAWKICRYDASTDFSKPESDWNPAGTADDDEDYIVASGTGNPTTTSFIDETKVLGNGRYVYRMTYTIKDSGDVEHSDAVVSAPFTVYTTDYQPAISTFQLMDITAAGAQYIASQDSRFTAHTGTGHTKAWVTVEGDSNEYHYITRTANRYYLVSDGDDIIFIDATIGAAVRADYSLFNFTSDYYVMGFLGNDYADQMAEAKENGTISTYTIPTVWIAPATISGTNIDQPEISSIKTEANKATRTVTSNGRRIYGRHFTRNGNLDVPAFAAYLEYAVDGVTKQSNVKTDKTTPVVPGPYDFKHYYEATKTSIGQHSGKYLKFALDPAYGSSKNNVYIAADELDARNLNVIFEMHRPNVDEKIINYYDIVYDVEVQSTMQENGANRVIYSKTLGDPERDLKAKTYKFSVLNIHPDESYYPIFHLKSTTYKPNGVNAGLVQDRVSTYNNEIYEHSPNEFKHTDDDLTGVAMSSIKVGYRPMTDHHNVSTVEDYNTIEWMYKEHNGLEGATIKVGPTKDKGFITLDSQLYMIELGYPDYQDTQKDANNRTIKGQHFVYPYLVQHHEHEGHSVAWNRAWDQPGATIPVNQYDRLQGTIIATSAPATWNPSLGQLEPCLPSIYITPVYIFNHQHAESIFGENNDLITELKPYPFTTPSSVRAKAPALAAETATRMPNSDDLPAEDNVVDMTSSNDFVAYSLPAKTKTIPKSFLEGDQIVTGIGSVCVDEMDGEEMWFNLQGVRVDNPTTGVYIHVRGNHAEKVNIK